MSAEGSKRPFGRSGVGKAASSAEPKSSALRYDCELAFRAPGRDPGPGAAERRNILISGGTGSGKTTLANAILAEPAFARDRVFLIEDTPELQCSALDQVSVLTRRAPVAIGVADLVRVALRMRPDRVVVGEMRDGAAAVETLKSWNTGHPGGLCTLHANSAEDALRRVEDLACEVLAAPPRRTIGQAVDLIAHVRRTEAGRRLDSVVAVKEASGEDYDVVRLA